jgi:RNA-directed DNA polymerase
LGYRLIHYGTLIIAEKSIAKVKRTIKRITKRNNGQSLENVIQELNLRLPGWVRYYGLAKCKDFLQKLDSWIRRKLRCIRIKQCKRPHTIAKMLISMGVKEYQAWIVALSGKGWWRLSGTPQAHQAMNNKWFDEMRLINLERLYLSL